MAVTIDGTNGISGVDGSVGTPSYRGSDADTGLLYPSAGVLALATNGTERLRIDTSGNVGIGTASPISELNVATASSNGGLLINHIGTFGTDNGAALTFTTSDRTPALTYTGQGRIKVAKENASATDDAVYMSFATQINDGALTERMRITSAGNVGIGLTSPYYKFQIQGAPDTGRTSIRPLMGIATNAAYTTAPYTGLTFNAIYNSSGTYTDLAFVGGGKENGTDGNYAGYLQFNTRSNGSTDIAERMRIDSSGNVGIGTASPSQLLTVNGTTQIVSTAYNSGGIIIGTSVSSADWRIADSGASTNALTFGSVSGGATTERMRIDTAGNVGIGTTSTATSRFSCSSGATLTVGQFSSTGTNTYTPTASTSLTSSTLSLFGGAATSATTGIRFSQGGNFELFIGGVQEASGAASFVVQGYSGSVYAERFRIESAGTLTSQPTYDNTAAGSTVVVTSAGLIRRTSSSLKYKKDIETLDPSLADNALANLRPVWYRSKDANGDDKDTWSHIGLIAEEVDLVEPRLVRYRTVDVTHDEEGKRVETVLAKPEPEDVDYGRLSVLLLDVVQRQQAQIAELTAKINELAAEEK